MNKELIELPKEWHYNIQSLRMEKTVEVRDENDELIGYYEHCAIVPDDILTLISHEREEAIEDWMAYLFDVYGEWVEVDEHRYKSKLKEYLKSSQTTPTTEKEI